jgi:hypothetical protein
MFRRVKAASMPFGQEMELQMLREPDPVAD